MLGDNVGAWKRPLLHFTAWRVEMILLILITIIKTLLSEGVACVYIVIHIIFPMVVLLYACMDHI
jgi:hypothetical protein